MTNAQLLYWQPDRGGLLERDIAAAIKRHLVRTAHAADTLRACPAWLAERGLEAGGQCAGLRVVADSDVPAGVFAVSKEG